MNYDIVEALSQIAREKGVELLVLVERLESSLLSAAKRKHGANAQVAVNFDEAAGTIEMTITKTVVGRVSDRGLEMTSAEAHAYKPHASVGDDVVIPLDIAEFGRNAIQAARQVLIQGVREAERERVYSDFSDKVGDVIRGVVQQVDRGTIILKLDTAEAVIPAREVLHRDRFRQREMVRGLVIEVDKDAKGPQIILSRSHPDFLLKLFVGEVPEITDKIVEIKAIAREPGHRSKIAVTSNDERVDAVGACVGIKGTRVQSIVRELGGERIDIVPWSADPVVFVSRSLAPAKVIEAKADPENHKITVIVPDDQLSLAIGKQGQNARLAAKLTGWKIELHSQTEYKARTAVERADLALEDLDLVDEDLYKLLLAAGIETALDIERKGLEGLAEIEALAPEVAGQLYGVALEALAGVREAAAAQVAAEAEEADQVEDEAEAEANNEGEDEAEDEAEDKGEAVAEAEEAEGEDLQEGVAGAASEMDPVKEEDAPEAGETSESQDGEEVAVKLDVEEVSEETNKPAQ